MTVRNDHHQPGQEAVALWQYLSDRSTPIRVVPLPEGE